MAGSGRSRDESTNPLQSVVSACQPFRRRLRTVPSGFLYSMLKNSPDFWKYFDDGCIWIGVSRTDSVMDLWTVNGLRWRGWGGVGCGVGRRWWWWWGMDGRMNDGHNKGSHRTGKRESSAKRSTFPSRILCIPSTALLVLAIYLKSSPYLQ